MTVEIWYKVGYLAVAEVEFSFSTENGLYRADGTSCPKKDKYETYFATEEEAVAFAHEQAQNSLEYALKAYRQAQAAYDAIVREGVPVKRLPGNDGGGESEQGR